MGRSKAAGVNFRRWLQDILGHIHEYNTEYSKDMADFLSKEWKKTEYVKVSETSLNDLIVFE